MQAVNKRKHLDAWHIELAAMHACGELMSPRIFTYVLQVTQTPRATVLS